MLNFAEQTGSGAVIVVWSFLMVTRVLFTVIMTQFKQWRELWRGAALVRTAVRSARVRCHRLLPRMRSRTVPYSTNRTCTVTVREILSAPPCVTSTKAYDVSSRAPNAQSVRYR